MQMLKRRAFPPPSRLGTRYKTEAAAFQSPIRRPKLGTTLTGHGVRMPSPGTSKAVGVTPPSPLVFPGPEVGPWGCASGYHSENRKFLLQHNCGVQQATTSMTCQANPPR